MVFILNVLLESNKFKVEVNKNFLVFLNFVNLLSNLVQLLLSFSLVHVQLSQDLLLLDDVVLVLLRVFVSSHGAILGRVESLEVSRGDASTWRSNLDGLHWHLGGFGWGLARASHAADQRSVGA